LIHGARLSSPWSDLSTPIVGNLYVKAISRRSCSNRSLAPDMQSPPGAIDGRRGDAESLVTIFDENPVARCDRRHTYPTRAVLMSWQVFDHTEGCHVRTASSIPIREQLTIVGNERRCALPHLIRVGHGRRQCQRSRYPTCTSRITGRTKQDEIKTALAVCRRICRRHVGR
jgi:hypothetical protein